MKIAIGVLLFSATAAAQFQPVIPIVPPGCTPEIIYECPPVETFNPSGIYSGAVTGHILGGGANPNAIYQLGIWTLDLSGFQCEECATGQNVIFGTYYGMNYGASNHNAQEIGVFSGVMNADGTTIDAVFIPTNCFSLGFTGETNGDYTGGSLGPVPGAALIVFNGAPLGLQNSISGRVSGKNCVGWTVSADIGLNIQ